MGLRCQNMGEGAMKEFSDRALADDRYAKSQALKEINIHPKEWFLCWGFNEPVKLKKKSIIKKTISEIKLYPSYSHFTGWQWVTEERHKIRRCDRELVQYGEDYSYS